MSARRPWQARQGLNLRGQLTLSFALLTLISVGLTGLLALSSALQAQRQLTALFAEQMPMSVRHTGAMPATHDEARRRMQALLGAPGRAVTRQLQQGVVLAALLTGALAVLTATLLARRLTRSLTTLLQGTRRLTGGELGVQLRPVGQDEVGQLTGAFNMLSRQLAQQDASRRALVADVAHDLRTPVAILRSRLEAVQDGLIAPDSVVITGLHAETLRLGRLVEDLRLLSLAESGGLTLHCARQLLQPLLRDVVGSYAEPGAPIQGTFRLLPGDPELRAIFDADRLTQILRNLLDNAALYGGLGVVEITAARGADGMLVSVRDHGPGVPDAVLERLFERMYRADEARTRSEGRSGLGLAIARALAHLQGGQLSVRRHPEAGLVFTLTLQDGGPDTLA